MIHRVKPSSIADVLSSGGSCQGAQCKVLAHQPTGIDDQNPYPRKFLSVAKVLLKDVPKEKPSERLATLASSCLITLLWTSLPDWTRIFSSPLSLALFSSWSPHTTGLEGKCRPHCLLYVRTSSPPTASHFSPLSHSLIQSPLLFLLSCNSSTCVDAMTFVRFRQPWFKSVFSEACRHQKASLALG